MRNDLTLQSDKQEAATSDRGLGLKKGNWGWGPPGRPSQGARGGRELQSDVGCLCL